MYFCHALTGHTLKQIFFIFFLFTGIASPAAAENPPVFHQTLNQSFRFSYTTTDAFAMNNILVREIARINYLNLYRTGYDLEYALEIKITASGDDELFITSNLMPERITGDITYKGFDLTPVITPDIYGFSISVFDHNRHLLTIEPANLPVGETAITALLPTGDFDPEHVTFLTSDHHLTYNNEKITAFNRRVAEINEFLACLELLELSVMKARKLDPEKSSDLLATHFAIFDLSRFQHELQQKSFTPLENAPEQYVSTFQSSKTELNSHLRRLRTLFTKQLTTGNIFFNDQSYAKAAEKIIEIQTGYVEAMKQSSHFHEPVYIRFANFFAAENDWNDLLSDAQTIFSKVHPAIFRKNFGAQLWQAYLESAETFLAEEKYNEALLMLSNAEVICSAEPDIDCGLKVFQNMARARFGIYDAYLRIAESAMNSGNLDLSRHYLDLARIYQSENSGLIIIPAAVNRLAEMLAWQYFESGRSAVKDEHAALAMAHLNAAKEVYQMLNIHDFDDAIEKELIKMERLRTEADLNNSEVQN
jgi:tetratricopeptide (TPR) repeat protein